MNYELNADYEIECKRCGKTVMKSETEWSRDCQGIVFRRCCFDCLDEIDEIGFDGAEYTSADECIDEDY